VLSHLRLVGFCLGRLGHLATVLAVDRLKADGHPLLGWLGRARLLGLGNDGLLGNGLDGSSLQLLDIRPVILVSGDDRLEAENQEPKLVEILFLRGFFLFVPDNRRSVVRLDGQT